jgi:hypothetical protein
MGAKVGLVELLGAGCPKVFLRIVQVPDVQVAWNFQHSFQTGEWTEGRERRAPGTAYQLAAPRA